MSTVEAAASLFGSDGDSEPDPFAVIGNEDTTPPHDEHQVHTSAHPSQMGQESSSWFAEQMYPDPQQAQHDPWFIPTAQDVPSSQSLHSGGRPSYDHQQGHHPGATPYEPRSGYATSSATSTPYQNTSTSYEAYNPTPPTPCQYSAQQSSYDPYNPTTSMSTSNSYAPREPTRQLSTVPAQPQTVQHTSSYNSVVPPVPSPYTASMASQQQQPPNGIPAQAFKPPSAPTAAKFRPKASNAYDPPLPPPKVNRTTSPSLAALRGPPTKQCLSRLTSSSARPQITERL
ncbi:hypothetical protein JVU11DRAFT_591 [Chiua virens]|nr:hypothetical protein JVU11DRAFT_591 [Chiua virens]